MQSASLKQEAPGLDPGVSSQMAQIVETQEILNGEPRIAGTRVGVLDIAELVLDGGYTPADTADQLDLAVAAVYHALAYYHDHASQMRELRRARSETEATLAETTLQPPTQLQ